MGVTVHFSGNLGSPGALDQIILQVSSFAERHGWPAWPIDEELVTLKRVINEENVDYVGPIKGIGVQPHADAEPLQFEFDRDLFLQEYCKTQFAGSETHKEVVDLLRYIQPLFADLDVYDEAEYWETGDESLLCHHIDQVDRMIIEAIKEHPGARGPVRLASGRIADIVE
jgi:hypothetical protein